MQQRQIAIALSRDRRLEILDDVDYQRAELSAREWQNLRRLVEAIEESTDRMGHAPVPVLATKCRFSERTLYRVASCGRRAGVIVSAPAYDDQGRSANEWRVAWDRLSILARSTSSMGRAEDCSVPATVTVKGVADTGSHRPFLAGTVLFSSSAALAAAEELKTSSNRPGSLAQELADTEWRRLEEVLFSLGIDRAAVAIAAARSQGVTLDQLDAIVAHWVDHGGGTPDAAWGPGALCWRIQNARPQIPAERSWPPPSDAWSRRQRHNQRQAEIAAEVRAREARRREREEIQREQLQREAAGAPGVFERFRALLEEGAKS
jgi:hypothetical protein